MSPRSKGTLMVAVLLYAALIYSVLTERTFWTDAFGPTALGFPMPWVVTAAVTLLYLPAPWIVWHAMALVLQARAAGMPLGHLSILYTLFTIGRRFPALRRSQYVAVGGLCYFIGLMAAWIYYANSRGL